MMTGEDIRLTFLEFFQSKGHKIVPSAPIVVKNDPTLMFTNAGMNPFKDYFLGNITAPYPRIADTQKCLRVSGKHNDLEEVGVDTYHHTMFEMLGNWSFGDPLQPTTGYFKKEAIEWSWELLTKKLNIPPDRIYVTVFEGSKDENIEQDTEAINEWKKWIADDRILAFGKKDNFWEMGDTGPCGPCTEIHIDTRTDEERKSIDGKTLVNADHPLVIEIWNNVFIQYNRLKDGTLKQLPALHVDTGMGFERLVRVLQQKNSNYDTDIFSGTIKKIEDITRILNTGSETEKKDIAFRVISDHIRAISFAIADGQLPSNIGAGYVIRRILRRAVRYYYSYLNYQQPLLFQLVAVLASQFEKVFPELKLQEDFITKLIKREEELFLNTLELGLRRFNTYTDPQNNMFSINPEEETITHINIKEDYRKERAQKIVAGNFAFQLYDTFGFPIDLTQLIASEKGFKVDEVGYEKALKKQKDRSRAASLLETGDWIILKDGDSKFVGYNLTETTTQVIKYRKVKSQGKEIYQIVLETTPFYAESGGQIGDSGSLFFEGANQIIQVIDTKKEIDLNIHFTEKIPVDLTGSVKSKVDVFRRRSIANHHSATHLLHAALRKVLGLHVSQKGSLVSEEILRFDFSHFNKVADDEIRKIEEMVNEKIRQNIKVDFKKMSKDEATEIGAMSLFGEKYKDEVRVVIMDFDFSKELCGGTHVSSTGELGLFKITSESSIASGVRRIEAITGVATEKYINEQLDQLLKAKEILKHPKDIIKSIQSIADENARLKKDLEKNEQAQIKILSTALVEKIQMIKDIQFIGEVVEISNAEALKKIAFDLKSHLSSFAIVLAANIQGKPAVVLLFDEHMATEKGLDASKIVKQRIAPIIKGGGGGQKTLATAGGQDVSALHQVIEAVKTLF